MDHNSAWVVQSQPGTKSVGGNREPETSAQTTESETGKKHANPVLVAVPEVLAFPQQPLESPYVDKAALSQSAFDSERYSVGIQIRQIVRT